MKAKDICDILENMGLEEYETDLIYTRTYTTGDKRHQIHFNEYEQEYDVTTITIYANNNPDYYSSHFV